MDIFAGIDWKTISGSGGILLVLAAIAYKIYQVLKADRKADTFDDKIDKYSNKLQETIDKLAKKIEDLQTIRERLVDENANFKAKLLVAEEELEDLRKDVQTYIARIKYLEEKLKEAKIFYV